MQLFEMHRTGRVNLPLFFKIIMWSCVCEYLNKKSDWLPVSAGKLLRKLSGITKMPNHFFGQYLQKKIQNRKMTTTIKFYIFEIDLVSNSKLNVWTKFTPKEYLRRKKGKKESHHRVLHIRISLGVKFQLREIILIF